MIFKSAMTSALLSVAISSSVYAAPDYQFGNILVSSQNTVFEYTPDGTLVSQFAIPENPAGESARDIIVLENGNLAVYNGTFEPVLSIFDGSLWTHHSIEGWSTVNNGSYGGIDTLNGEVILTNMNTAGAPDEGLLKVNLDTKEAVPFVNDQGYIDVTIGQDGLIYALQNTYGDLDIYDPATFEYIRSVDLGHTSGSRGVTANAQGDIFLVSWNEYIARYNAQGELQKTLPIAELTADNHDINIDASGRIVVGGRFGKIYLTDESLNSYSSIKVNGAATFVALVPGFEPSISPPVLTGSHSTQGKWTTTTLNWTTEVEAVDVYFNGSLVDTLTGVSSAIYQQNKRISQSYYVCNAGTLDCSETYTVTSDEDDGSGGNGGGKGGKGNGGKK